MRKMLMIVLGAFVFLGVACSKKVEEQESHVFDTQKKAMETAKGVEGMTLQQDQENRKKIDEADQ